MEEKLDSVLVKLDSITNSLNTFPLEDDLYIKYLMPFLMLLFSIGAKIVIDREADVNDAMKSLFKIPAELTFVCTSLLIAFAAYDFAHTSRNLFVIVLFIFLGMLNIFLSRRASKAYDISESSKWLNITIGSSFVSILVLIFTIILI